MSTYYERNKEAISIRRKAKYRENAEAYKAKANAQYRAKNPNPNPRGVPPATEKVCPSCEILKVRSEYYKKGKGVSYHCKPCTRAQQKAFRADPEYRAARYAQKNESRKGNEEVLNARRKELYDENRDEIGRKRREKYKTDPEYRAACITGSKRIKRATPKWIDREQVKEVYRTCPEGYEVDHIIPLRGESVCGLHVHENLQHLTAEANRAKTNNYSLDMDI